MNSEAHGRWRSTTTSSRCWRRTPTCRRRRRWPTSHFTGFAWDDAGGRLGGPPTSAPQPWPPATASSFLTHADTDLLALEPGRAARCRPTSRRCGAYNLGHLGDRRRRRRAPRRALPDAAGGRRAAARRPRRASPRPRPPGARCARATDSWLLCVPGIDALDPELTALSTAGVPIAHEVFAYLQLGGAAQLEHALRFLSDHLLTTGFGYDPPAAQPRARPLPPRPARRRRRSAQLRWRGTDPARADGRRALLPRAPAERATPPSSTRSCARSSAQGANALPRLRLLAQGRRRGGRPATLPAALRCYRAPMAGRVDVVITTMSFAMGGVNPDGPTPSGWSVDALAAARRAGPPGDHRQAEPARSGTAPRARPRPARHGDERRASPSSTAASSPCRSPSRRSCEARAADRPRRAGRALRAAGRPGRARRSGWRCGCAALRRTPNAEKRDRRRPHQLHRQGRRASATRSASTRRPRCCACWHALRDAGYAVGDLPADGDALMHDADRPLLLRPGAADRARSCATRPARVPAATYAGWFAELPAARARRDDARSGASRPARPTSTTARSRWPGWSSATSSSRSSRRAATAWTRTRSTTSPTCRRRTTTTRSTAGCATTSGAPTRSSTSASTARSNGCPARASACRPTATPTLLLGDLPLVYPFIINDPGEGDAGQAPRARRHRRPPDAADDDRRRLRRAGRAARSWSTSTTRSRRSTRPSCRCSSSRSGS